ncbi:hypothetical protein H0I23_05455 [Cellulophaga sp. HaHaR_3_176]|uniref:hypothetical protein n=1 Tax=Cellulophaga sp. HaHaR_3_176 TaxID=1942464 RepID=UPI001C1F38EF|nr:hypothetical protein [Cellulophaga sp. HaHaR_3_176]QWX85083.1 hypothetical protein H0I23_05455 [Cellulophaga sp. HaHaR_3_176]
MIEDLPIWIDILFILTFLGTIVIFYFSNNKPKLVTLLILIWSGIHCILAYNDFYKNTLAFPSRFTLILLPSLITIVYGATSKRKQWMLDNRNIAISTFLHTIRIPVEIVLLFLFIHKMVPELMTFEDRNFDILAGLTAPIVAFLFIKRIISKKALLIWNVIGLCLVLFILINGILSSELPFQQFGFEQPNRAITYFPYILLPATIVPLVIYTHITDIIKLKNDL